ncbi:unnamed protein product [Hanseniaspora opuntiae]
MADISKASYIKKDSLYIFDLNTKMVNSLKNYTTEVDAVEIPQYNSQDNVQFNPTKPKGSINFCSTCNTEIEGREHFKSDSHNQNLKRSLKFDADPNDDSDASISGSDEGSDDELETIEEDDEISIKASQTPFHLFESDMLTDVNEGKLFAGYKCLFNKDLDPVMQLKTNIPNSIDGKSAVFMIGGWSLCRIFHRYTTRRKQGGSQSANDSSGSVAHSAGASIRRYNEMALEQEIKELIKTWEPELKDCEHIFIKANVRNRKILVNSDSCLKPKDPRLMTLPFNTRRPTSSELKRSWAELTYLKIIDDPKTDLKIQEEKEKKLKEIEMLKKSKVQVTTSASNEQAEISEEERQSEELLNFIKKSKIPALVAYIKKHKYDINQPLNPEVKYQGMTPLHYASQSGQKQTAWQLAKDDTIKHQFQLARHKLGESVTDWEMAKVGQALSKEEIQEIEAKANHEEHEIVEEVMQKELEKLRLQKQEERKNDKKIGGNAELQTMEGMSEEQKRAYMREVRARAAEARMKR